MEGYLEKWSKKTESFEKRYVVICPNNKTLFYFINDDMKDINNPRGRISLEKVLLSLEDSETPTFTIILDDKKVLLFKAPDINSRNAWISKISEISLIFHHNNDKNTFSQSQLCLDALKDSSDELRDALESSTQWFNVLIIHQASDAENDEISADQFFDCREISESPKIISISDDQDGVQYDIESDYNEEEIPINASIITHMLSQVKIGMDLSKITLPTFILERRSLLEMFGDFFSRPAHLYNAVKMVTPKERFVAVLQYYMGSFYPGRRVEVSKKPYNPILGEKFQCFYKFNPDRTKSPNNIQGPVSWAKTWDLSFIAEQVSHHPPISAFYAECPEAKVSCNAYIYTKSRFLGLSIGVQNIGKGVVSLHQYDEDYEFNFPSGYAR
ncbi:hypothetical protein HZS_7407 [Henneguya salminicola]|nr:hypothetical protein HZS_7407 [Henneguya salminicola]